jgi:hypothetical protein
VVSIGGAGAPVGAATRTFPVPATRISLLLLGPVAT